MGAVGIVAFMVAVRAFIWASMTYIPDKVHSPELWFALFHHLRALACLPDLKSDESELGRGEINPVPVPFFFVDRFFRSIIVALFSNIVARLYFFVCAPRRCDEWPHSQVAIAECL